MAEKILLGVLLIALAAVLNYGHLTERLDHFVYDAHLGLWSSAKSEDIVLVTIDDRSLELLGRWPWPRRFHAELLDALKESKSVGLDIIFSEADLRDLEGDALLASAIERHGKVVLPVAPFLISADTETERLGELSSQSMFSKASAKLGHVDVELDSDGISRSVFLNAGVSRPDRKALPLAMYELDSQLEVKGERNPFEFESSSEGSWVRDHKVLIPFSATPNYFQNISFVDALDSRFDRSIFKDKWVLVGLDAVGLSDRIPTPISKSNQPISGVEFEAHVLDILLNEKTIKPLDVHVNLILTLPFVLLLLFIFDYFKPERAWLATFYTILATLIFSCFLSRFGFLGEHFWFRPGPALIILFVGYILLHRKQLSAFIASLSQEKEHVEIAMSTVNDAVVITDQSGFVEFMNTNAESLTGYLLKNVRGHALTDVMAIENMAGEAYPIDIVAKSQQTNSRVELPENYFLRQRNGHLLPLRANARPFLDDERVSGVIVAFDESKSENEEPIVDVFDDLTGLPNKSLLFDRLEHAISNANRTKRLVSVLWIDLDDFNKINDAFGKENGNEVLKEVAARLTSRGRTGDTVARIEGDEFVVILENLEDTEPVASVATSLLEVLKQPFLIDQTEVLIEASIGISVFPKDGMDAKTLKDNAYTAMKGVKRSRRLDIPRFRFYSQKMNKWALERLLSEKDLRSALSEDNFELYYQPRVDFSTGQIVAVEALIRWRRPGEGLIMPTSFIPLAERSGLITEIGTWVIESACAQAKAWERTGMIRPRMAINLSPRQFMQHDLLDTITRILDKSALHPCYLELEITENSLVRDADRCIEILKEFRSLGGTVSIDDFGTGYSSLSYLKNFPVDILKVDKVFTKDITTEPEHAAITLAVISMAHSLNLQVVAEGVETEAQFNFLRAKGCDELQGYFFSKPLSAIDMTSLLQEKRRLEINEVLDSAATTLLLVDDDHEMLTRMGVMLRDEGYRILMANSGSEALDLLARHSVGVIVSDEVMPGMRGSELLERIKKMYPRITRVLLSATADRDTIISAINSGAIFKYLNKPISEPEFKSSLREAFARYSFSP